MFYDLYHRLNRLQNTSFVIASFACNMSKISGVDCLTIAFVSLSRRHFPSSGGVQLQSGQLRLFSMLGPRGSWTPLWLVRKWLQAKG